MRIKCLEAMNQFQIGKICMILVVLLERCSAHLIDYDHPTQLHNFLENITGAHRAYSSLIQLGNSYERQPIYCVKIGKGGDSKPTVIVEFGIHGREWVSHTSATHVIYEFLNNPKYDDIITNVTWYILPLLNPDGLLYSKNLDRAWRKNRRRVNSECVGVDVNRNFPVYWERDPTCGNEYGGEGPSSESETLAVMKIFDMLPYKTADAYIAVHSDAQCILLPYGFTSNRPQDWKRLQNVAWKMKRAMEWPGSPVYEITQASDLYVTSGTSVDWAYVVQKVPLAFTLELPFQKGKYTHLKRFTANSTEKIIIAKQCIAALEACALEIMRPSAASPTFPSIASNLGIITFSSVSILLNLG